MLIQILINGILLGGLYAVLAIGMSLVFGIIELTNLAHGDLVIFGSYMCMFLAVSLADHLLLGLLLAVIIMMIIGFVMQKFLINRVMNKGSDAPLLVTFGISIILSNVLLLVFGADAKTIHNSMSGVNIFKSQHFSVSAIYFLDFVVAVVVILLLNYIMKYTFFGRSIRATADNVIAAELMGVATKRMYVLTMVLAMIVAAISGLLIGMTYVFYPMSGTQYLIIAFGVVVIGGMGNLIGTLLGGIILGLAQLLGGYFFGSSYQLLVGYLVLLILLTIKPQGLLARAARR